MKLVCIHGNSLDKTVFDSINVEGFEKYSLNLPGHGLRDIGSVKGFADLVESVFEEIKPLKNVVLFGTSLGGHIAHHLLAKFEPLGIVTIAAPPLNLAHVAKAFLPNPLGHLLFQADISLDEAQQLASSMLSLKKEQAPLLSKMISQTNPQIRQIIGNSLGRAEFLDEVELLKKFQGKKILIVPQSDTIVNRDYIKSLKITQTFEVSGNHMLTMDNPSALNELLSRELRELRK
jgi:pimeloyl-ACP methyl ester carboxylesterase